MATYRENRHRPILVWSKSDYAFAQANRELAVRHGRADVAALIDKSIARSRRVKSITEPLRKLSWQVWNATYQGYGRRVVDAKPLALRESPGQPSYIGPNRTAVGDADQIKHDLLRLTELPRLRICL